MLQLFRPRLVPSLNLAPVSPTPPSASTSADDAAAAAASTHATPKASWTTPRSWNWNWITLTGRDAEDFLHRITTVHVRGLATGEGALGFLLNAQGKIRGAFRLWRFGEQDYAFEMDAGSDGMHKTEFLTALDQLTFAEQIALTDIPTDQLDCAWVFAETAEEEQHLSNALSLPAGFGPGKTIALPDELRLCAHGREAFGRAWFSLWGRPARLNQWLERDSGLSFQTPSLETLNSWEIGAVSPHVGAELLESSNPLELGLVRGIASDKGCYPGQEVIERTISLGSPAQRLAQIEFSLALPLAELPEHSELTNQAEPPQAVGTLTRLDPLEPHRALAMIRKIHAKENLEVQWGQYKGRIAALTQWG
jgi:folate-binding protein YgfZ